MISGSRGTLPPEAILSGQNNIDIIAAQTQVFSMESFVSASGLPWQQGHSVYERG
jgi:hypothetical protein